jgi:hypothetical protein
VRRLSGVFGLILFLAPLGLRLATAAEDTEAMRCAIACGHAAGTTNGASCCPMPDAGGSGPLWKTCVPGGDAAIAPVPMPFLIAFVGRLPVPTESRPLPDGARAAARPAFERAPEKVPLLLG